MTPKPQANKTISEILDNLSWAQWELGNQGLIPLSKNIAEATKAITQAMLDALPEQLLAEAKSDWGRGFDEAINQMESTIKLMGEKYTEMEQL